jgi:tRNA(fMet)-specific endonuclease VapC
MYLLDTNHCSFLLKGDQQVLQKLTELGDLLVATCVIVQGELMFMAFRSKHREANLQNIQSFLQEIKIFSVDKKVADLYGKIKSAFYDRFGPKDKRKKQKIENLGISENDLWIAAIAKRFGLIIVSADKDFQRLREVVDIPVETWLTSN